ncbi:Poly [ADP-ribose] polymerase 2 [Exaiptasia diaphana]|nr:Poly [ADP-ribose] polymerase 2 [Exaiptasia diaphana]
MNSITWKEQGKEITVDLDKLTQIKKGNKTLKKVRRFRSDEADPPQAQNASTAKMKLATTTKMHPASKKVKNEPKPEEAPNMKSLVFKGNAPIDSYCPIKDKVHIYCEGSDMWDAMLNQTNVQNNNNKFYLIQLLEDDLAKKYYVWMRWGRVGFSGQNTLHTCGASLDEAKKIFTKKFSDKTKNTWEERQSFAKVSGKYDLLIMDYKAQDERNKVDLVKEEKPIVEPSKLDVRIQTLIELICNVQAMEEMLKEMKYDTNKAPLGKLTTEQIRAGYEALKDIESCINGKDFGKKLVKACDAFYTRIPHCFGMKRPPLITSSEEVKIKIQLLEALGDIQIAVSMLKDEVIDKDHPIDRHYKSLQCDMTPLDHTHDEFKLVEQYLLNTHAKTHNQYNLELVDVFALKHHNEDFKDLGNRMLLWHGSRLTNWVGIIRQGLRIAPPEAPVTGYMNTLFMTQTRLISHFAVKTAQLARQRNHTVSLKNHNQPPYLARSYYCLHTFK